MKVTMNYHETCEWSLHYTLCSDWVSRPKLIFTNKGSVTFIPHSNRLVLSLDTITLKAMKWFQPQDNIYHFIHLSDENNLVLTISISAGAQQVIR